MDPLPSPSPLSCQPARQFPEEESASQFQVEELGAGNYLFLGLQLKPFPLAGYITQLHFQFVPHISWCPYSVMGWGAPGGVAVCGSECMRPTSQLHLTFPIVFVILPPHFPPLSQPPLPSPLPLPKQRYPVSERPEWCHTIQPHCNIIFKCLILVEVVDRLICPAQQPVLYVCHPGIVDTASAP